MNRSIVIVFDCLPAHWLGCYGNFDVVTPAFDWLATQSVVFDRHFANSPGPAPLVTGRHHSPNDEVALESPVTLPERTADQLARAEDGTPVWLWMPPADDVLPAATEDADDSEEDEPDEHVVEQSDEMLMEALEQIEMAGWSDAMLIVTSRDGVKLSEYWSKDSASPPDTSTAIDSHSSNMRLPLFVRHPTVDSFRTQAITQPVDILPTLKAWNDHADQSLGHSLLPLIDGSADQIREHAFYSDDIYTAIIADEFVLIGLQDQSREPQLFLQPDDRWLVHNVAVEYPDVVDELTSKLLEMQQANS